MFDLPVETRDHRRQYARFRKLRLKEGFVMLQYSVYARHGPSEESIDAVRNRVRHAIPPNGQVRLLPVTDHQFGKNGGLLWKKTRPNRGFARAVPAVLNGNLFGGRCKSET
jgi:CRISPR-associated protein Cas2